MNERNGIPMGFHLCTLTSDFHAIFPSDKRSFVCAFSVIQKCQKTVLSVAGHAKPGRRLDLPTGVTCQPLV